MILDETKKLNMFLSDIVTLRKRSKLLESILAYYNPETLTFEVPEKWTRKMSPYKFLVKTPRHFLYDKIREELSSDELASIGIYE